MHTHVCNECGIHTGYLPANMVQLPNRVISTHYKYCQIVTLSLFISFPIEIVIDFISSKMKKKTTTHSFILPFIGSIESLIFCFYLFYLNFSIIISCLFHYCPLALAPLAAELSRFFVNPTAVTVAVAVTFLFLASSQILSHTIILLIQNQDLFICVFALRALSP